MIKPEDREADQPIGASRRTGSIGCENVSSGCKGAIEFTRLDSRSTRKQTTGEQNEMDLSEFIVEPKP